MKSEPSESEENRREPSQSTRSRSDSREKSAANDSNDEDKKNKENSPPKTRNVTKTEEKDDDGKQNPPSKSGKEGQNKENESSRGKANQPESRPTYSDGKVGRESLERHFPRRRSFRRMKTWAGDEINREVVKADELAILSRHPSFRRLISISRTTKAEESGTKVTSTSPKPGKDTTQTKTTKEAARIQANKRSGKTSPALKSVRRNPTRAARLR